MAVLGDLAAARVRRRSNVADDSDFVLLRLAQGVKLAPWRDDHRSSWRQSLWENRCLVSGEASRFAVITAACHRERSPALFFLARRSLAGAGRREGSAFCRSGPLIFVARGLSRDANVTKRARLQPLEYKFVRRTANRAGN
jgi:hypothetical protein